MDRNLTLQRNLSNAEDAEGYAEVAEKAFGVRPVREFSSVYPHTRRAHAIFLQTVRIHTAFRNEAFEKPSLGPRRLANEW